MKTLFTSALAGKLADQASSLFGSNPLVKLGAAGIAARVAAASLPLALVAFGAVTYFERKQKGKKAAKPRTKSARSSAKGQQKTGKPAAAAA